MTKAKMLKIMLRRNSTKNSKQINQSRQYKNLPDALLLANNKSKTYETKHFGGKMNRSNAYNIHLHFYSLRPAINFDRKGAILSLHFDFTCCSLLAACCFLLACLFSMRLPYETYLNYIRYNHVQSNAPV